MCYVAQAADLEDVPDPRSISFVGHIRTALREAFEVLRAGTDAGVSRDVLQQLTTEKVCRDLMQVLVTESPDVGATAEEEDAWKASSRPRMVQRVSVADFQPLRLLTWNVSGGSVSHQAPPGFTTRDKMAAVQLELKRDTNAGDIHDLHVCKAEL